MVIPVYKQLDLFSAGSYRVHKSKGLFPYFIAWQPSFASKVAPLIEASLCSPEILLFYHALLGCFQVFFNNLEVGFLLLRSSSTASP